MPKVSDLLRAGLLKDLPPDRVPGLDKLRLSERSPLFEQLRSNRKVIGAMRYGLLGAEDKPQYDRVKDMIRRLQAYQQDKNKEHLVDVANICEMEFVEGEGIFAPKDDGEHTPIKE